MRRGTGSDPEEVIVTDRDVLMMSTSITALRSVHQEPSDVQGAPSVPSQVMPSNRESFVRLV